MDTIDLEAFPSGQSLRQPTGYRAFVPNPICRQWRWRSPELSVRLEEATHRLGELNASAQLVPDSRRFLQLYIQKEAVISSRIEGTQTRLEEALLEEEDIPAGRREDWREVRNYTRAMNAALQRLGALPLSGRLLKETHRELLAGVRGQEKQPGEYRSSQNWIGGHAPSAATFVPPPAHAVPGLMSDLEHFLNDHEQVQVPHLIRIGLGHYQFETIHPFLDGNGRIGRLMIPLYLVQWQLLSPPLLYLSAYFEQDRQQYYERLMAVRLQNDWLGWLLYFLCGVQETAGKAVATLQAVLKLTHSTETLLRENLGQRAGKGLSLLETLFAQPIVDAKQVQQVCGLSPAASYDLLKQFVNVGILFSTRALNETQTGSEPPLEPVRRKPPGRQARKYIFRDYVHLFRTEG